MIVAGFRAVGLPVWIPDWLLERLIARDEQRARAIALELVAPSRVVVCPSCGIPFTRYGARRSADRCRRTGTEFQGRTREEIDTCIVCREGLDPVTLEPIAGGRKP